MEKMSYMKENVTGIMKENSPPCQSESADGCHNEQLTNSDRTAGDNGMKIHEKQAMPQQPLQVSNNQLLSAKQNVQPELLKKFRQLRQWQQQQQETMFKKQQQQMENIKMQQDRLQALFNKSTTTSPGTVLQSQNQLTDAQFNLQEANSNINNQGTSPLSSIDGLLRTVIPNNYNEHLYSMMGNTDMFSPLRNHGYSYQQGSPTGQTNSPVLMTPMQFTKRSSTSPTADEISHRAVFTVAQPTRELLINGIGSSPNNHLNQDFREPYSSDNESDYHSDADTMSGVYPLQDDNTSEACPAYIEQNNDTNTNDEEDFENTVCERPMNNEENDYKDAKDDEERPINPGIGSSRAATFEEFLEKELKGGPSYVQENSTSPQRVSPSPQKPIRTFLKKGQGLARFKMRPPHPKKHKTSKKSISPANKTGQGRMVIEKQEERPSQTQPAVQIKVQRKIASRSTQESSPTTAIVASSQGFGSSTLASRVIGPFRSMPRTQPMNSKTAVTKTTLTTAMINGNLKPSSPLLSPVSSLDFSFQNEKKEFEETKDDEDLEEFEMLEQAAANASFSSNSSLVTKVIQRAKAKATSSNHTGKPDSLPASRSSPVHIPNILSPVDTGYGSCEGRGPESVNVASQGSSVNGIEIECSESDDSDNDTTLKEELDLDQHPLPRELIVNMPTAMTMSSQEEFDDEEAWGEIKAPTELTESESDSDDSDVTIGEPFTMSVLHGVQIQQAFTGPSNPEIMSTPPASALMSKLFPKLKEKPKVQEESNPVKEQHQAEVTEVAGPSREVQEKLKELEEEIDKFRAENKALAKIRNERDEGLKRLQNEINLFEKQKTDELERIERFKKEEMQKLKRERKVFEKYQKAAKSIPDKKERDEIEALKSQVSELQEELKRRESRWSAASSRYRNRIEALEEQNKELQEEVKLLEKYRLEQWRENQSKAKDNEEAKPRETVLRKTAKPVEPVHPEALTHHMQEDAIPSDKPAYQLSRTLSPLREDDRIAATDANNNKIKSNSSNLPRKGDQPKAFSPGKKSFSPSTKTRTSNKQDVPINEPANHPSRDNMNHNTRSKINHDLQEIEHPHGKVEKVQPDGSRVISFTNGTKKEISQDGQTVIVSFFNGDIKQVFPDQRVVYHYSEAKTTHTTYPDGLEVLQFPNNQIEKHYVDGTKEIIFPDQTIKYLYVDGTEECVYADGTIQRTRSTDGEKIIEFPNGQREVHTKHFKRREYPDGTVKTVYPDGRTETRYSTGRLRVKDRDGRIVMDTEHLLQE